MRTESRRPGIHKHGEILGFPPQLSSIEERFIMPFIYLSACFPRAVVRGRMEKQAPNFGW
jgi:hypothetical protein